MGPIPTASAGYNPMVGAAAPTHYGHPYSASHHAASSSMHSLPPSHVAAAAAHMHPAQQQQNLSMHPNAHMMSAHNGPVLLVSNLNEEVSSKKRAEHHDYFLLCINKIR